MHIAAFDLDILGANGIVGAGMGIAIAEATTIRRRRPPNNLPADEN